MILLRNVKKEDTAAILRLAGHLGSYNLPKDPKVIRKLIRQSTASFLKNAPPSGTRTYLFAAEDTSSGKVIGCSLIIARHGTSDQPHLCLEVRLEKKKSARLKRSIHHYTLKLRKDRIGSTEIGGLVTLPSYRSSRDKIGKQLSYVRFLYMARRPSSFKPRVLVEYLPRLRQRGGNDFWSSLGRKFTGLEYETADRLSTSQKEFILSLFPKEKIYCCLLDESAVRNLGIPGKGAERSLGILQKTGFRFLHRVDPFDGGPHYGAALSQIRVVRDTRLVRYRAGKPVRQNARGPFFLVAKDAPGDFRCVLTPLREKAGRLRLTRRSIRALELKDGEKISITPFER